VIRKQIETSDHHLTVLNIADNMVSTSGPVVWDGNRKAFVIASQDYGIPPQELYTSTSHIGLTPRASNAIDWAIEQKALQETMKEKIESNPALKEAYENFKMLMVLA
jgi:hypothetical protein